MRIKGLGVRGFGGLYTPKHKAKLNCAGGWPRSAAACSKVKPPCSSLSSPGAPVMRRLPRLHMLHVWFRVRIRVSETA